MTPGTVAQAARNRRCDDDDNTILQTASGTAVKTPLQSYVDDGAFDRPNPT
jgi:hypothetical protein